MAMLKQGAKKIAAHQVTAPAPPSGMFRSPAARSDAPE